MDLLADLQGGVEDIRTQPVHLDQHGELIQIEATARGRPVEDGGYLWRGELRLWDNEILMGWYAANDGSVRSKGTMYFVMHPHGIHATGRWVGLSYDGNIVTGWSSMARTEAEARELVDDLRSRMPATASEVCEVIITAPDPDWLVEFTRRLVTDRLSASGHNFQPIRWILEQTEPPTV